jgi:hypothetical protein
MTPAQIKEMNYKLTRESWKPYVETSTEPLITFCFKDKTMHEAFFRFEPIVGNLFIKFK